MNATFVLDRSHSAICPVFSLPSPPNRSVLRVRSGVRAALRRGAEPEQPADRGFFLPHRPSFSLTLSPVNKKRGEKQPFPMRVVQHKNNLERNKTRWVSRREVNPRKAVSQRSEETGRVTSAAGVTLCPSFFPPHCDALPPPPASGVTTDYYHYFDFSTRPSPSSQISLPSLFFFFAPSNLRPQENNYYFL